LLAEASTDLPYLAARAKHRRFGCISIIEEERNPRCCARAAK
jgi:hypothetical protein